MSPAEPASRWPFSRTAIGLRMVIQELMLFPVTRLFCSPFGVTGRGNLQRDVPYIFISNHSSHSDTAALLRALPYRVRRRTAPAAAEDYFFKGRVRALLVRLIVGAFPFPRRGQEGLHRAKHLLDDGWSVILFPEGTRSTNGSINEFRCGAARLGSQDFSLVPIGIAGTGDVLAKGAKVPRRAPVAVAIGEPIRFSSEVSPEVATAFLRKRVVELRAEAAGSQCGLPATVYSRLRKLARTRTALWLVFLWAFAEALLFPVVPDFVVAPLAFVAPSRFLLFAGSATLGSVGGGIVAHLASSFGGGDAVLGAAPLVTDPMVTAASQWLGQEGPSGLLHQPLSGVPYKVFALQSESIAMPGFVAFSFAVRGARLLAVASIFAVGGVALRDRIGRAFGPLLVAYAALFALGLLRVVHDWS